MLVGSGMAVMVTNAADVKSTDLFFAGLSTSAVK